MSPMLPVLGALVVGAALSFGGGADEHVQGFLEVGVGVSKSSRSVQSIGGCCF